MSIFGLYKNLTSLARTSFCIFLILFVAWGLSCCGGNGDDTYGVITITGVNGYKAYDDVNGTPSTPVEITGYVQLSDPSERPGGEIYWYADNGTSGVATIMPVFCLITDCSRDFYATVPLLTGDNRITFNYLSTSKSILVRLYTVVPASGRVSMASDGTGVPGVSVGVSTIRHVMASITNETGDYVFDNEYGVHTGYVYTITPRQPPPQSDTCYIFSPPSRTIGPVTGSLLNVDFEVTLDASCYSISGSITGEVAASNGVSLRLYDGDMRWYYTSVDWFESEYHFYNLPPGTYTLFATTSPGYEVQPASRTVNITNNHITGIDFIVQ